METFTIVAIIILVQVIVYFVFACIVKWITGNRIVDVFNPFYSWTNYYLRREWERGYKTGIIDQMEKELNNRLTEDQPQEDYTSNEWRTLQDTIAKYGAEPNYIDFFQEFGLCGMSNDLLKERLNEIISNKDAEIKNIRAAKTLLKTL